MRRVRRKLKRLCVSALSVAIAVSFMPLMGGTTANAAQAQVLNVKVTSSGVDVTKTDVDDEIMDAGFDEKNIEKMAKDAGVNKETMKSALDDAGINMPDSGEIPMEEPSTDMTLTQIEMGAVQEFDTLPVNPLYQAGETSKAGDLKKTQEAPRSDVVAQIDVQLNSATGLATVTGTVTGDQFDELYVDGTCESYLGGSTVFTKTINMKDYDVGLHDVYATLAHNNQEVHHQYMVPTYVYAKPSNRLRDYYTGKNYLKFCNGTGSYPYDYDCPLYLEYKKSGGQWSEPQGPISVDQTVVKKGLASNTKYSIRLYYGKVFTYGDNTYFISGKDTNKVSAVQSIKTAQKRKPAIKSLTASKAKQWYRKLVVHYYVYGQYAYSRVYKIWYTNFNISLKLKKKPGTTGIGIGSKMLKGNKKAYKTKFLLSGKQKGKKLKFDVYSYQHKIYGGLSPSYRKKVKIK